MWTSTSQTFAKLLCDLYYIYTCITLSFYSWMSVYVTCFHTALPQSLWVHNGATIWTKCHIASQGTSGGSCTWQWRSQLSGHHTWVQNELLGPCESTQVLVSVHRRQDCSYWKQSCSKIETRSSLRANNPLYLNIGEFYERREAIKKTASSRQGSYCLYFLLRVSNTCTHHHERLHRQPHETSWWRLVRGLTSHILAVKFLTCACVHVEFPIDQGCSCVPEIDSRARVINLRVPCVRGLSCCDLYCTCMYISTDPWHPSLDSYVVTTFRAYVNGSN